MAENPGTEKTSSPLHESVRIRLAVWWTGGVIILAALIIVLLWKIPQWQVGHVNGLTPKEWFDSVNEARKTLATILGGIVVLAGAYFTWRNIKLTQESVATAQKALLVSQEGQITDRYTKAIEQLGAVDANGKKKLEVRLGGIYALERIANQSEKDHWPVIEVLSAYVRENALSKRQGSTRENRAVTEIPPPVAADIQAILTVLGRRDRKYEDPTQELDLRATDLSEAKLSRSNLSGANLLGAYLIGTKFNDASLHGACLIDANLFGAFLDRADLSGAFLNGAQILGAGLTGANLTWALLDGADLTGADLRQTKGLTQAQIDAAIGNSTTQLPEHLHMPERWAKE